MCHFCRSPNHMRSRTVFLILHSPQQLAQSLECNLGLNIHWWNIFEVDFEGWQMCCCYNKLSQTSCLVTV